MAGLGLLNVHAGRVQQIGDRNELGIRWLWWITAQFATQNFSTVQIMQFSDTKGSGGGDPHSHSSG